MSAERKIELPANTRIEGILPHFGIGIETKMRSSGLRAGPYTLIFADAVVPVTKRIPVMALNEEGSLVPVLSMSSDGRTEEELMQEITYDETTTVLVGLGQYKTRNTNGSSHDTYVGGDQPHIVRTYTHAMQESQFTVSTIKETNTLLMEHNGRIVRFHTVENELKVPVDGVGIHNLEYNVGIMEYREEGQDTRYALARVMYERDGSEIKRFRVEDEPLPFT